VVASLYWFKIYDKEDLQKLFSEVLSATHGAMAGIVEWDEVTAIIHEWHGALVLPRVVYWTTRCTQSRLQKYYSLVPLKRSGTNQGISNDPCWMRKDQSRGQHFLVPMASLTQEVGLLCWFSVKWRAGALR
jgi:hypothetical protein